MSSGLPSAHRLALLAIGAATLVWQVASARSVMAGLYGNELTLGLVLASWLLLMGLATALAAWLLRASSRALIARRLLPPVLLLCPAAMLASLMLQRSAGLLPAFTSVGQVVGPGHALGAALLCLLPPCLLLGGALGLLSLHAPGEISPERWAARIYLWESLGTVAAGVAFHHALSSLSLPTLGVAAGISPWLVGLILALSPPPGEARVRWIASPGSLLCALAGFAALGFMLPVPGLPGRGLLRVRLPGYELREQRNSRHGALAVLSRGDQILFSANGIPVFSNQDRPGIQGDIHLTLLAHPRPGRVLLISGGLGGGLTEVLRHPVTQVDYVELDPEMFSLARRWGSAEQRAALADPRVKVLREDGRRVVARSNATYDLILVGLPGPSSALINRFYTEQFFRGARQALKPRGLLRISLPGSETYMGDQQALLHQTVQTMLGRSFPGVITLPGQTTLLLAGRDSAPRLELDTLVSRLSRRRLDEQYIGPGELRDRVLPFKQAQYHDRLKGVVPLENTDLRPGAYFRATLHWLTMSSPAMARSLDWMGRWCARRDWPMPLAALAGALLLGLLMRRRSPAGPAVAIAGFSGMAVELSLLLFCQEQRGVIYHEVGALMTAFMAGLAAGAHVGAWLVPRWPARAMGLSLAACAAASLAAMGLMLLTPEMTTLPLVVFLLVMALVGLSVGACYAPAAGAMARRRGSGPAAAYSYAWDLGGAAAGALLASAFILPVLGLPNTCLFCAALCVGYGVTVR